MSGKKILALVICAGILGACTFLILKAHERPVAAGVTGAHQTASPGASFPDATSTSFESPPHKNIILSQKDNNTTVVMGVGDEVLLQLPDSAWNVSFSDTSVLMPVKGYALIKGIQGIYTAAKSGETTLIGSSSKSAYKVHIIVK